MWWLTHGLASRVLRAPENDDGFDPVDDYDALDGAADDDLPPEDDDEEGGGGAAPVDGEEPPARRPGRREREVLRAKEAAKRERQRAETLQQQLNALAGTSNAASSAQRDREEREAYALMSPEERADFDRKKLEQANESLRAEGRLLYADLADQRAFDRLCARDQRVDRIADAVEERLAAERQKGNRYTRIDIAHKIIAESVLRRAPTAKKRQAAEGQRRLDGQRTTPARTGGGAGGGAPARAGGAKPVDRQSERAARLARLKDAVF